MSPRSFSEDGAAGAGNSLDDAPATPRASTPAPTISNNGGGAMMSAGGDMPSGGGDMPMMMPSGGGGPGRQPANVSMPTDLGRQDTSGQTPWGRQFLQNTGGNQLAFGGFYAEGGAIPEEDTDPNAMARGPANGLAAMMQKATASVQEVLAYGRQKHGIGGGSDEGAIKEAARMPSVPGNPSDSGVRPPQPMPGPLPPTSNPFGKRADAQPQDQGDGAGAIDDTEEEMA